MKNIYAIITGGTIDKEYEATHGELHFKDSIIPKLVEQARFYGDITFEKPFLVDSLDMSSQQRQTLVNLVQSSQANHILITHGTDTLIETGLELLKLNLDKTIILTGAMVPARVSGSDALANVGQALSGLPILPRGVYAAFQGEYFPIDDCIKDKKKGLFLRKTL